MSSKRASAGLLALVTSFLVVLSGIFVVPTVANAVPAGPSITVTPSENLDPAVANTLTVKGSGFTGEGAANGAYVVFGEKSVWAGQGPLPSSGWIQLAWVMPNQITDGEFTTTLLVPANTLDPAKQYHVATSAAHALSATNRTMDTFQDVTVLQPVTPAVQTTTTVGASASSVTSGDSVTLTATVAPSTAAGSVAFFDNGTAIADAQAQAVAGGSASYSTTALAVGSHAITAKFTPSDAAAFTESTTATATTVEVVAGSTPNPPADPTITASVTAASTTGLTVSATVENIVLRAAADVPDTHKDDQGVYIGIIEKGHESDYGTDASAGAAQDFAYKMFIAGGKVTRTIQVPAAKLDRTKQYVAVTWLAHGMLNDDRYLSKTDLNVSYAQWNAVFPVAISTQVTEASATGLKLSATIDNIVLRTAAETPNGDQGVYVGIIEKGHESEYGSNSSAGAKETFIYKAAIVNGKATSTIDVPAAKLDRTKQYVAVTWLAHGFLDDTRYLGQTDINVSWSQWDAVFGAAAKPTTLTVTASAASVSAGHQVGVNATLTSADIESTTGSTTIGKIQFYEDGVAFGAPVNASLAKNAKSVTVGTPSSVFSDGTSKTYTAIFTPTDATKNLGSTSTGATVTGTAATGPWTPEIHVFVKTNGQEVPYTGQKVYKGDELVVKGAGFDPEANVGGYGLPVPVGPQGTYVVFGNFDSTGWEPSTGAASSKRKASNQGWVLTEATLNSISNAYKSTVESQWVKPENGAFTWSSGPLTTPAMVPNGEFGIYIYAAGGTKNPAEEQAVLIDYVDSVRPGNPQISVFLSDGATPYTGQQLAEGDKLVVKGTGFDPYANLPATSTGGAPIPNSLPQGTFVVFGKFAADWKPSNGVPSSQRTINKDSRAWLLADDTFQAIPNGAPPMNFRDQIESQWVELDPTTGAFEATITLKTPTSPLAGGEYGIYTYAGGAGQVTNAAQELKVAVNYTDGTSTNPETPATGALQWGIKSSFVGYVTGAGSVTAVGAATRTGNVFNFPQITGGEWNGTASTGTANYGGGVSFSAHGGALSLSILDPVITVTGPSSAVLSANVNGTVQPLVDIDLSTATKNVAADGSVTWTGAKTALRAESVDAFQNYPVGEQFDDITFTVGAESGSGTTPPVIPPVVTPPVTEPTPTPTGAGQQAGSLIWSISSAFQGYVTGAIAKGSISTNGVGGASGAYLYPQANGGSWNAATQTGTVAYSGVVTFTGHGGLLSETYANPVITVSSATSGTISVHGETIGLNLAAATKTVGANGEVTWSNVPVNGTISGGGSSGGSSGGGSLVYDNLTFTVGATSAIQYGSTTRGDTKPSREAAPTAPTATGLKIVTPKDEFVPGGEIEIEATGFEPNERDILVVLYSDPIVLDRNAGADADGKVRWIGTLPKDLPAGKHTLTLQGSKNAGAELTVVTAAVKKSDSTAGSGAPLAASADVAEAGNDQAWVWWIGAGALVVLAAALAGLVVSQRRRAAEAAAAAGTGTGLAG